LGERITALAVELRQESSCRSARLHCCRGWW